MPITIRARESRIVLPGRPCVQWSAGSRSTRFWNKIYYCDANIFEIFTHKFIYGDPKSALSEPASAVVSESFARKYFGDANPIGKTLLADLYPTMPRKITAVFRDLPMPKK
jgi:putative ABC transport system permease protein